MQHSLSLQDIIDEQSRDKETIEERIDNLLSSFRNEPIGKTVRQRKQMLGIIEDIKKQAK